MDERLIDFVAYVRKHPGITSAAVSEHFGVSVRTVRNWLHEANEALGSAARIASDHGSYTLAIHSQTRFDRLISVAKHSFCSLTSQGVGPLCLWLSGPTPWLCSCMSPWGTR